MRDERHGPGVRRRIHAHAVARSRRVGPVQRLIDRQQVPTESAVLSTRSLIHFTRATRPQRASNVGAGEWKVPEWLTDP